MFSVKSLASVLAIVGLSSAAAMHHQKRADDGITLFAYGLFSQRAFIYQLY